MADLVPNEGNFYVAPIDADDNQKANQERAESLEALPLLQDIIDWFDAQAEELNRNTAINLKHPTLSAVEQIHAHQLAIDLLKKKKGELKSIFDTYKPKR